MGGINEATPEDWDRLRMEIPAVEQKEELMAAKARRLAGEPPFPLVKDAMMRAYTDIAMEELETYKAAWADPIPFRLPEDAAARKAIPIYTGVINYFPRAIAAVAQLSLTGGIQHGQTAETLHWDRSKSGDEKDAMMRHIIDGDWEYVAWRALANLEKHLEGED